LASRFAQDPRGLFALVKTLEPRIAAKKVTLHLMAVLGIRAARIIGGEGSGARERKQQSCEDCFHGDLHWMAEAMVRRAAGSGIDNYQWFSRGQGGNLDLFRARAASSPPLHFC
jgi:hypothetical protein